MFQHSFSWSSDDWRYQHFVNQVETGPEDEEEEEEVFEEYVDYEDSKNWKINSIQKKGVRKGLPIIILETDSAPPLYISC